MAERHLQAYFRTRDEAEAAANKLRVLRVRDLEIGRMEDDGSAPVSGVLTALHALNSSDGFTGGGDYPEAALAGSGFGSHGDDRRGEVVLSAIVDPGIFEQAEHVVKDNGGIIGGR
jgi:hypothetical protein